MAIYKHRYAGKVFHADPLVNYVDATNEALSDWPANTPIDTSNLQGLVFHFHANQTTSFSSGSFYLRGTNIAEFDHLAAVALTPIRRDGDGTLSADTLTLPTSGNFATLLVYKDLPRFVYPTLSLSGSGSMSGRLVISVHGWMI